MNPIHPICFNNWYQFYLLEKTFNGPLKRNSNWSWISPNYLILSFIRINFNQTFFLINFWVIFFRLKFYFFYLMEQKIISNKYSKENLKFYNKFCNENPVQCISICLALFLMFIFNIQLLLLFFIKIRLIVCWLKFKINFNF